MRMLPLAFVCLAACLAALPAGAQTGAGTPGPSNNSPQNAPIPLKIVQPTPDQAGTLTADRDAYAPGQPVHLTFTVSNGSKKPVVYNFASGQQVDFTVNDPKGGSVWDWAKGRVFTQAITRLPLAPGGRIAFHAVWNGRDASGHVAAPGPYTLNARLTSNNGPAITGSVVVNNDTDPNNMGMPTRTPAENGVVRQVDVLPPVTASKTIIIGTPSPVKTKP